MRAGHWRGRTSGGGVGGGADTCCARPAIIVADFMLRLVASVYR